MTKKLENKLSGHLNSFKRTLKRKVLPLALAIPLLYSNIGCDLYNHYLNYIKPNNSQEEEQIIDKKKKAVILINTSELDKPEYDSGYSSLRRLYKVLRLNKVGYNSADIYVLGHDESYTYNDLLYPNFTFENYKQLTRKNLEDVINEINEDYSEDAFLMIHILGTSIKEDSNNDGSFDSFSTRFVDEKYYSSEYPDLVYSLLRNQRRVWLNLDQSYSGFIYNSFDKNKKDNLLILSSSSKEEEINDFSFSYYIFKLFYSDDKISGKEAYDYLSENMTNSTPHLWYKSTTNPEDFILYKYK
ncbi:MAG: hypothetical protein WC260_03360 [Candidatus Pacearchaeota archaeon]